MGGTGESQSGLGVTRQGNVFYGADDLVTNWVAKRIPGYRWHPGTTVALGILDVKTQQMAAGVVFENYNGLNIEGSIAAEPGAYWLTKDTLRQMFEYPFKQLNCACITLLVAGTNLKSLDFVTRMGFEGEAIVRFAAHDGSDLIVLKMFRDKCRWIAADGKEQDTEAA